MDQAEHTGIWRHEKGTLQAKNDEPPAFHFSLSKKMWNALRMQKKPGPIFFATYQIDPFIVVYEDMAHSFEETSLALLDFLAIPRPPHISFTQRTVQKQADSLNKTWAKRYLWERKSLWHRILRYLPYLRLKLLPAKKQTPPQ